MKGAAKPLLVVVLAAGTPAILAVVLGCAGTLKSSGSDARAANPSPFDARMLAAAAEYRGYERVSDRAHFAPTLCMDPGVPADARLLSTSSDTRTHGRKLYFLFVRDAAAYDRVSWHGQSHSPVGQTLVKETWAVEEVTGDRLVLGEGPGPDAKQERTGLTGLADGRRELPANYAAHDGRIFRTGERGDLFIMLKLDPEAPGTDSGWVYGVVSPDGTWVKAAGMIESCIGCHTKTGRDRLFGHPGSWEDRGA